MKISEIKRRRSSAGEEDEEENEEAAREEEKEDSAASLPSSSKSFGFILKRAFNSFYISNKSKLLSSFNILILKRTR